MIRPSRHGKANNRTTNSWSNKMRRESDKAKQTRFLFRVLFLFIYFFLSFVLFLKKYQDNSLAAAALAYCLGNSKHAAGCPTAAQRCQGSLAASDSVSIPQAAIPPCPVSFCPTQLPAAVLSSLDIGQRVSGAVAVELPNTAAAVAAAGTGFAWAVNLGIGAARQHAACFCRL